MEENEMGIEEVRIASIKDGWSKVAETGKGRID